MISHMLEIQRGRYKRPRVAPENRLCSRCECQWCPEDEMNFLLVCPKHNDIRSSLKNKITKSYPNF